MSINFIFLIHYTNKLFILVHLRGSRIIFVVLPPMLTKAPMFSRVRYFKKHRRTPPLAVEQLEAEKRRQQNKSKNRGQGG